MFFYSTPPVCTPAKPDEPDDIIRVISESSEDIIPVFIHRLNNTPATGKLNLKNSLQLTYKKNTGFHIITVCTGARHFQEIELERILSLFSKMFHHARTHNHITRLLI